MKPAPLRSNKLRPVFELIFRDPHFEHLRRLSNCDKPLLVRLFDIACRAQWWRLSLSAGGPMLSIGLNDWAPDRHSPDPGQPTSYPAMKYFQLVK